MKKYNKNMRIDFEAFIDSKKKKMQGNAVSMCVVWYVLHSFVYCSMFMNVPGISIFNLLQIKTPARPPYHRLVAQTTE